MGDVHMIFLMPCAIKSPFFIHGENHGTVQVSVTVHFVEVVSHTNQDSLEVVDVA